MDWLLAALALFNISSMIVIYRDRLKKRVVPPWTLFAYSLVASELAWLWLPIQATIAMILILLGGASSSLGIVSLLALILSWGPLILSIIRALMATRLTESALRETLGDDYLNSIPTEVLAKIEMKSSFKDWYRPFVWRKHGIERLKNIAYGPNGIKQRLDIYRPVEIPEEGCPVLMQIHGGAWMVGSKERQALPLINLMTRKGWICISINYRLSPSVGFPTHLEDCKRALCWIRTEGKKYGVNPDFVAVTGGSAGGHLAALMALTENMPELQEEFPDIDTSIQAAAPYYGVYDFLARNDQYNHDLLIRFIKNRIIFDSPEKNPELWNLASPISHVRPELPPFMIIQGGIDSLTTMKGARAFHLKLRETSQSPSVYLELPGAEHAFDNIHSPRTEAVSRGVHRFLEWSRAQHNACQHSQS